ncbi:hypothetical protein C8F01DRAFT_1206360 [Mycena amicta]|nr:hypothetical protein C8F01DRAFT_1206360 [Mycena amicta]
MNQEAEVLEKDPVWTSSRTARQIYALGQVEKQFVLEVNEYFDRLNVEPQRPHSRFQSAIRSSLAQITYSRIAPSAINAPPPNFVPASLGVGVPPSSADDGSTSASTRQNRGLQEERVERDAWKGILDALRRLKVEQETGEGDRKVCTNKNTS